MSSKKSTSQVFAVAGVEFAKAKDAALYASNLNKEFAARFAAANCSPFAFCRWIATQADASAVWFKGFVLGLAPQDFDNAEKIMSGLRAAYPVVNESGAICRKVTSAKGVFALEPVKYFTADVLDACTSAYLRGVKSAKYPDFFKVEGKGAAAEIVAIDKAAAEKAAETAKAARESAAAGKAAALASVPALVAALRGLVAATATAKGAAVVAARAAALEALGE